MKGNKIFDFSRKGFQDIINIMTRKINECVDISNGMIARVDDYISKVDWNKIINSELYQKVLGDLEKTNEQLDNITNNYLTISVKSFGAKGDGVTDDTLSFQNAINYAIQNKQKLIINDGVYLVSSITINDTVIIEGMNSTIKSIGNNNSNFIIKLNNNGVNKSCLKNINIDGNKDNNTNEIDGIYLYNDSYSDTNLLLERINIYDCSGNGIFISGGNGNTSIREAKFDKIYVRNCNKNGLYANSFSDSFIFNSVFETNKLSGIYLYGTASIKINNCKCYFNGREGNVQDHNKHNGIRINNCTLTMIDCTEVQDNCGDGIFVINSTQNQFTNISCDNNGLLLNDDMSTNKYADKGLSPFYYGVYLEGCNYNNIIGNFNNHRYNTDGYTQKSSIKLKSSDNNIINISSRLQQNYIDIENINYKLSSIIINGNHHKIDINLSDITLLDGYSFLSNNWNGCYMYVKNNIVYYKLIIQKNDYFPTTNINLFTLPSTLRPKYTLGTNAFMSKNYADMIDGNVSVAYFDANGIFHLNQPNTNMKIMNIQGTIDLNM